MVDVGPAREEEERADGHCKVPRTSALSLLDERGLEASALPEPQRSRWGPVDWILGTAVGQWSFLAGIAFLLLLLGAASWALAGGNADFDGTIGSSLWISYGLFIDIGTQTGLPASDPLKVRAVAVLFSVFGFVFNLAVLGLVVDVVRGTLYQWKQKHSRVIANGHVLVLGWGEKSLFLLRELHAISGEERRPPAHRCCRGQAMPMPWRRRRQVVVLAERPAMEMSEEVRTTLGTSPSNVLYKQGDPTDLTDLIKVSASSAEDILILGSGCGGSDQQVIQTLLALAALPVPLPPACDVFAEMQSQESVEVVKPLLQIAEGIVAREAVNRILILRALVPPVGYCYVDLVDFSHGGRGNVPRGHELRLRQVPPALRGLTFAEACRRCPEAVLLGLWTPQRATLAGPGVPRLIPPFGRILKEGDQLVLLAPSEEAANCWDLALHPAEGATEVTSSHASAHAGEYAMRAQEDLITIDGQLKLGQSVSTPRVVCIVGCPMDLASFLQHLDLYLHRGSSVHVLSPRPLEAREEALRAHFGLPPAADADLGSSRTRLETDLLPFEHITVRHYVGPTTLKSSLRQLPLKSADCVIILSEHLTEDESPVAIDSRNLTAVIAVRRLLDDLAPRKQMSDRRITGGSWQDGGLGNKRCKVITELLDPKSKSVVDGHDNVRKLGSFVYTNSLETGVFTMAVQEKGTYNILVQLLNPTSPEHIASAPISEFVVGEEQLSFLDLSLRVRQACGGILLGWKEPTVRYPELNPLNKAELRHWRDTGGDDLLILRADSIRGLKSAGGGLGGLGAALDEACLLPGCVPGVTSPAKGQQPAGAA
mmetsp:Transcript_58296/g.165768  ORF Transcript_58296/g.165768 Transcript_58296/m.165768 type:complete len:824 (-) Transcript_58296:68-2539(-)